MERIELSVEGERFVLRAAGPKEGELVLCAHGFPDHAPSYDALLADLARAGYRAVAPWLRGYAPSTLRGPFDPTRIGADLVALGRELSPDRPHHIIGHDWGAVATYVAIATYPERCRRAVTMAVPHLLSFRENAARYPKQLRRSWYMVFFQLPLLPERRVPADDFAFVRRLWRDWSPGYVPDEAYLRELFDCLGQSMPAPIDYYRHTARSSLSVRKLEPVLRELRVPLLYLHGEDDGCVGAEIADGQQRFFASDFEQEVVPHTGHFLHLEAPERVNARILSWLRS